MKPRRTLTFAATILTVMLAAAPVSARDLTSKTKWDRDLLKVITTQAGIVTTERYRLMPDGSMSVDVSRGEQLPITLIFARKQHI